MNGRAAPKVLVVEDQYLIAVALKSILESQGVQVLGPAARISDALSIVDSAPHLDCALLDMRLGDEPVFPLADALRARGIRFAFISGYDRSALPPQYRDATFFSKVEDPKVLLRWVMGP